MLLIWRSMSDDLVPPALNEPRLTSGRAAQDEPRLAPSKSRAPSQAIDGRRGKVLIVDDDESMGELT